MDKKINKRTKTYKIGRDLVAVMQELLDQHNFRLIDPMQTDFSVLMPEFASIGEAVKTAIAPVLSRRRKLLDLLESTPSAQIKDQYFNPAQIAKRYSSIEDLILPVLQPYMHEVASSSPGFSDEKWDHFVSLITCKRLMLERAIEPYFDT